MPESLVESSAGTNTDSKPAEGVLPEVEETEKLSQEDSEQVSAPAEETEIDLENRASPIARPQSRGSVSTTKKVCLLVLASFQIGFTGRFFG